MGVQPGLAPGYGQPLLTIVHRKGSWRYGWTNQLGARLWLAVVDNSPPNRFVAVWMDNPERDCDGE